MTTPATEDLSSQPADDEVTPESSPGDGAAAAADSAPVPAQGGEVQAPTGPGTEAAPAGTVMEQLAMFPLPEGHSAAAAAEEAEVPFLKRSVWDTPVHFSSKRVLVALAGLAVLAALAQVSFLSYRYGVAQTAYRPQVLAAQNDESSDLGFVEEVYDFASPAVVSIRTESGSSGTGFFYEPGKIMTNAHVVAALTTSTAVTGAIVTLHDGREREAKVEHVDPRMDIALLTIKEYDGTKHLAFADATKIEPGQRAVAIGSPLGLVNSVSSGVISAPQRNTVFRGDPVQSLLIQTDAAVNPGNSGGPLLDERGAVLGVITIRPDSAGGRSVDGVSFAIPSNAALASKLKLETDGTAKYVLLGVGGRTTNPDDPVSGMLVDQVTPGGSSATAGVEVGDYVTSIGGKDVAGYAELTIELLSRNPGDVVELGLYRDGKERTVEVKLKERPIGS